MAASRLQGALGPVAKGPPAGFAEPPWRSGCDRHLPDPTNRAGQGYVDAASPSVLSRWGLSLRAAAGDRDLAGAGHLDQTERANQPLERLDLVLGAGDLNDPRAPADVDDLRPEDLADLHHLGASVAVGRDLEQRQFP